MSKVFVVQKQFRLNEDGLLVPKFDLTSAGRFGQLVYLLSPTAGPFDSSGVISELHRQLEKFTSEDYLLLLGNPCFIGWATAVAASKCGGKMTLLQWSSREKCYVQIPCQL